MNAPNLVSVHAGLHKTGTTAIQSVLYELLHRLPRDTRLFRLGLEAHQLVGTEFYLRRPKDARKLLLSSEDLFGDVRDFYSGHLDAMLQTKASLASLGIRDVLLYFRPQWFWLESVYRQLVLRGLQTSPEEFSINYLELHPPRFSKLAESAFEVFGVENVRIRWVVPGFNAQDDYFRYQGLNIPEAFRKLEKNQGNSNPSALWAIQSIFRTADEQQIFASGANKVLQKLALPEVSEPKSLFSKKTQSALHDLYLEDREALDSVSQHMLDAESPMNSRATFEPRETWDWPRQNSEVDEFLAAYLFGQYSAFVANRKTAGLDAGGLPPLLRLSNSIERRLLGDRIFEDKRDGKD